MSGPCAVPKSIGSPMVSCRVRSTRRDTTSSCSFSETKRRVPDSQACPWWKKQPKSEPSIAISRSASSRMMLADLPPSSRVTFLMVTLELGGKSANIRSEEHTSELQSLAYLVCRLLLEKKKKK